MTVPYTFYATDLRSYISTHFTRGSALLGWSNFFVTEVSADHDGGNWYKARIVARGIFGAQPIKAQVRAGSSGFKGDAKLPSDPGGNTLKVSGRLPLVSVQFSYCQTTQPILTQIGRSSPTLPDLMPTPPSPEWTTSLIAEVSREYNWPNGWVLDNRRYERVGDVGGYAYFVEDDFTYYQELQPS